MQSNQSFADVFKAGGVSRRDFLKFCSLTSVYLGLSPSMVPSIVEAMEKKPRTPVIWLHGQECTCCSESFIRSSHPTIEDIVFNLISLDYDDVLSAAAGHQLEDVRRKTMKDYKGKYILAVEGNVSIKDDGVYCMVGGDSFLNTLKETAADAAAVIAWGACASFGCVQNAHPNPSGAVPISDVIKDKPIVKVPGCPPISEVMTGVVAHFHTFGTLPELDRFGRPKAFYNTRIHDKCYRRAFFEAVSLSEALMMMPPEKGGASTKWDAKARLPITHALRYSGTVEPASRSVRVIPASVVQSRISGIRGLSTPDLPKFHSSAVTVMPTRSV